MKHGADVEVLNSKMPKAMEMDAVNCAVQVLKKYALNFILS